MKTIFALMLVLGLGAGGYYFLIQPRLQTLEKVETEKSSKSENENSENSENNRVSKDSPDYSGITVPDIVKKDIKIGTGKTAITGKKITVHYSGWIYDPAKPKNRGDIFTKTPQDSPHTFILGEGDLVDGWEQGIVGMKVDGKRQIIIPADKAYGPEGVPGQIPASAILMVDVSLMNVVEEKEL